MKNQSAAARARKMNGRVAILQAMGFEIDHEDRAVGMGGYDFDFSSVNLQDQEAVLRHVVRTVAAAAKKEGILLQVNVHRAALRLPPLQELE